MNDLHIYAEAPVQIWEALRMEDTVRAADENSDERRIKAATLREAADSFAFHPDPQVRERLLRAADDYDPEGGRGAIHKPRCGAGQEDLEAFAYSRGHAEGYDSGHKDGSADRPAVEKIKAEALREAALKFVELHHEGREDLPPFQVLRNMADLLLNPAEPKANLGVATTRELLGELAARIEVDGANGGGGLDYRTVDGRVGAGQ